MRMRTKLAGTSHYQDNLRKWGAHGMTFSLIREPNNPYDPNAIRVAFLNDTLAYVPRELMGIEIINLSLIHISEPTRPY